jgi:hypothetical protein
MGPQHDRYLNCLDPNGFSPNSLKDMVAEVRNWDNKYVALQQKY